MSPALAIAAGSFFLGQADEIRMIRVHLERLSPRPSLARGGVSSAGR
jgi:hypothetical protein